MALAGITADWLFATATKTEAEALLASLENADGVFLIRNHKDPTKCTPITLNQHRPHVLWAAMTRR